MKSTRTFIAIVGCLAQAAFSETAPLPGMVWIPEGECIMGTDEKEAYPVERPAHRVKVDGFLMDETEVTNAQFAKFVEATKYVTIAVRVLDWEDLKEQLPSGTEKPSADKLVAGSLVFTPTKGPPARDDVKLWWTWTKGVDWRFPEGPKSSIAEREQHSEQHEKLASEGLSHNPPGPARGFNPREPHARQRVIKGGSFLCAENYCVNYRPSSRRGTDYDTGMSHLGFRCVLAPGQRDGQNTKPPANKTNSANPNP